jgi:predicted phage terminase large subunit-like protein
MIELPAGIDRDAQLLDLDRVDCEESLYRFVRSGFPSIDPATWIDSWAVEAICDHLQAVADGEIRKLIMNISPRCLKTITTCVGFPAWVWAQPENGPTLGPKVSFMCSSYGRDLSMDAAVKSRQLVSSPWYRDRWGSRFELSDVQSTKTLFVNNKGGRYLSTSVSGGTLGRGADIIIADDLNDTQDALSEANTETALNYWNTVLRTRLNNPKTGAFVVIQQRLAENDITGHILEKDVGGWCHVMIPMRYEPERSFHTVIGWKDPRTEPGQLMWPERFGEYEVSSLEKDLGPYASAGQLQQRPEPAGGGIIKREWWKLWEPDAYPPMDFILATLDGAYTEDRLNDASGMIVWGIFSGDVKSVTTQVSAPNFRGETHTADGKPVMRHDSNYSEFAPHVMCMYGWDARLELHELVTKVATTCIKMKVDLLLIENKASGISVSQEIRRLYTREKFGVELFDPKSQDKAARLYSVQHLFAEGIIYGPDRPWMDRIITQVGQFPKGKADEYVDLTSMGLRKLRDMGLLIRQPERDADLESRKIYPRGQDIPLYPA